MSLLSEMNDLMNNCDYGDSDVLSETVLLNDCLENNQSDFCDIPETVILSEDVNIQQFDNIPETVLISNDLLENANSQQFDDITETALISNSSKESIYNQCDSDIPETVLICDSDEAGDLADDELQYTTILDNSINIRITCTRTQNTVNMYKGTFTIGSSSNTDFCIFDNPTISHVHAIITLEDDGNFYISDNDSSNKTFVEGVAAIPGNKYRLFSGSRFMLSDEEFIFQI